VLRELYRQAATLMGFNERDRGAQKMIQRFEVDRDAAAIGGEGVLVPLLGDVALGSVLEVVLGHMSEAQPTEQELVASAPHRLISPGYRPPANDRRRARPMLLDPGFSPESHPRLVALQESSQAGRAGVRERIGSDDAASVRPWISRGAEALAAQAAARGVPAFSAQVATQHLLDLARRAGAEDGLHRPVEIDRDAQTATRLAAAEGAPPPARDDAPRRTSGDPLQVRMQKILARIEHTVAPAPAVPRKEPRPDPAGADRLPGEPALGPSAHFGDGESRYHMGASGRAHDGTMPPTPAPIATSVPPASAPSTAVGGFRRLAELGRLARASATVPRQRSADSAQLPAIDTPPAGAAGIDPEQLAELLRLEALRHGVDLAGLEP
jgi:hypothetical protein